MALLPAVTLGASNEDRSFLGILLLLCRKRWTNLVRGSERHGAALFRAPAGWWSCESEQALAWCQQEQADSEDGLFSLSQIHMQMWLPVAGIIIIISAWSCAGSGIQATSGRTAQLAVFNPAQE